MVTSKVVALIGRPNVGKSTLFNRILGKQRAITDNTSGVTRDRHYAQAEWAGKSFTLIDTGGFVPKPTDAITRAVKEQTQIAIEEADAVVFVVDVAAGITPLDQEIANIIRKTDKRVLLIANKAEGPKTEAAASEFYSLGLGRPWPISALNGKNIGDFLDLLVKDFQSNGVREDEDERTKVAILGRPNVGKSSLMNALLREERSIVMEQPGTTRDSIDGVLEYDGEEYVIIDTAGLRKKSVSKESVEFYSTLRALRSIERCDVAVVLIDAAVGLEKQDQRIAAAVAERRKGLVLAVNKWDLIKKGEKTTQEYERALRRKLKMLDFAPIVFISAKTGQRIHKVLEVSRQVHEASGKRIPTHQLNEVLLRDLKTFPPSSSSGKEIKIQYCTQVKTNPPVFSFFTNEPMLIQTDYKRFVENKIRKHFGFEGVPLTIKFRRK